MAQSTLLSKFLWSCLLLAWTTAKPTQNLDDRAACPLTYVRGYAPGCGMTGWLRQPSVIKTVRASSAKDCARQCLALNQCESFRILEKPGKCFLYSKGASKMSYDPHNPMGGEIYDRKCFSTDCNTIKACERLPIDGKCRYVAGYAYCLYIEQVFYSCSFGYTAKTHKFEYRQLMLNGTLSPCAAVMECGAEHIKGSIDVHYHIPSQKWICRRFKDLSKGYPYAPYIEPFYQHVDETRYTVKNASVGAGYGYYIHDFQDC